VAFLDDVRAATAALRSAVLRHPFVRGLGDGTLPADRYRFYLTQDYLFLIAYARVIAVAAAKASDLAATARFASLLDATLNVEMELHRGTCARHGVAPAQLERAVPAPACRAYTEHLEATAWSGTIGEICASLVPCQQGYAEIAEQLAGASPPSNPYAEWIEAYTSEQYRELAAWLCALTDEIAVRAGDEGRAEMLRAYRDSAAHELAFWDMAWAGSVTG
jgi:thiaminase/transcriptional activator TenA